MATTVDHTIDNTLEDPGNRAPLVLGGLDYNGVTETVASVQETPKVGAAWWISLFFCLNLLGVLGLCVGHLLFSGVGVWGNNNPAYWGWPIVNFVFWVGIGHAGTLISAILFLFRQNWRTSINRAAEAMTIFAVMCAGLFPGVHIGRVWVFLLVVPNSNSSLGNVAELPKSSIVGRFLRFLHMQPFRFFFGTWAWFPTSQLSVTDVKTRSFDSFTRFCRLVGLVQRELGIVTKWLMFILAALATPLVLSVHTIVSFDFAVSQVPGWHTTIFPPYFVAGAIFSGFAMVVTLMVPARAYFGLKNLVTIRHLENMNKIIMATGLMVGTAYTIEFFIAWYGANDNESFAFINRAFGPYWWAYWIMFSCNVFIPQLFWFKKVRVTPWMMVVVCIFVNIGMWFERFVIIITSLARDFTPSSWALFKPTWIDIGMLVGSFGLFGTLFLLFCRYLPMVAIAEVKSVMPHDDHEDDHGEVGQLAAEQ